MTPFQMEKPCRILQLASSNSNYFFILETSLSSDSSGTDPSIPFTDTYSDSGAREKPWRLFPTVTT